MALSTNLIWAWYFDEASGNAIDSSWNGNTLTNNGVTGFVTGKFSNAADFWTANTTKWFSNATAVLDTSTAWTSTIAGWVNINTAPASGISYELFSAIKSAGRQFEFKYENVAGVIQLSLTTFDGTTASTLAQTQTLTVGTWYLVAWTISANSVNTYLNGAQLGTTQTITATANGSTVNNFTIGRHTNASAWFACSKADETWAWNRAITSSEVSELYNGGAGIQYPFSKSWFFMFM